jgi:hypothetical protein
MNKYGVKTKDYLDSLIWLSSGKEKNDEFPKDLKKKDASSKKSQQSEEDADPQVRANRIEQNLISLGYIRNMNNFVLSNKDLGKYVPTITLCSSIIIWLV